MLKKKRGALFVIGGACIAFLGCAAGFAATWAGLWTEPFHLPDGCYYTEDGTAILKVEGDEGLILTPAPINIGNQSPGPVQRVRLDPRTARGQAHVDVAPGILLTDHEHRVEASGQASGRFLIDRGTGGPTIMVPVIAHGEMPIRRGRPC